MTQEEKFMREAIRLSVENVSQGGGPFAAVIVKDGEIIAKSGNTVTIDNDPTAHAEVSVIRKAAKKLGTYNLEGCEIYSSCEPCPMCFGAIYWAKLNKLYFANNKSDAKKIGFDDAFIYDEINLSYQQRKIPNIQMLRDEALAAFEKWDAKEDKERY